MVWCVIVLEQVLVWDSFTLKHGQLQVSGAISTHHQEHNCGVQPEVLYVLVGYCIGAGTGLGQLYT
jgi:hypothetical protein